MPSSERRSTPVPRSEKLQPQDPLLFRMARSVCSAELMYSIDHCHYILHGRCSLNIVN